MAHCLLHLAPSGGGRLCPRGGAGGGGEAQYVCPLLLPSVRGGVGVQAKVVSVVRPQTATERVLRGRLRGWRPSAHGCCLRPLVLPAPCRQWRGRGGGHANEAWLSATTSKAED